MKIQIKKVFHVQVDARKTKEYLPGVYEVGVDIDMDVADKMQRFGGGVLLFEKQAPENKVVEVTENKTRVAKKSGRRRSTRAKSDK